MNNKEVDELLKECASELQAIRSLLHGLGDGAKPSPFIKKYAIIRATGTIESGFKQVIADRVDKDSHEQLRKFIEKKIRNSSCNPRLEMIENMLSEFDEGWRSRFDEKMALSDKPSLKGALANLVNARNSFAHGGNADLPIDSTINFFDLACTVIKILDEAVHGSYDSP